MRPGAWVRLNGSPEGFAPAIGHSFASPGRATSSPATWNGALFLGCWSWLEGRTKRKGMADWSRG